MKRAKATESGFRHKALSTASIVAALALFGLAFSNTALADSEKPGTITSFDRELGIVTAGDWRFWLDGDLVQNYRYVYSYTNQNGADVAAVETFDEPLRLIRPTFLMGEPGEDIWIAIKAEMGSEGRSFIDHWPGSPRAGAAAAIGYGGTGLYIANGATQDVRTTPIGWVHSTFATSYYDNTFTKRGARPVSGDYLDATPLWGTMLAQLLDDHYAGAEVFHDTVAVRHDTGYGIFGVMMDFTASAFQFEYRYRDGPLQVHADLGHVSGVQDRWGNEVNDTWARLDAGYMVTDNVMIDGYFMTNFGEVRSHNGYGPGSYSLGAGATWEFIENNHVRAEFEYADRNITNRFADTVNFIKTRRATLGYGVQYNANVYLEAVASVADNESSNGLSTPIVSNAVTVGIKF